MQDTHSTTATQLHIRGQEEVSLGACSNILAQQGPRSLMLARKQIVKEAINAGDRMDYDQDTLRHMLRNTLGQQP